MQTIRGCFRRTVSLVVFLMATAGMVLSVVAQPPAGPPPVRDDQIVKIVSDRTNIEIIEKFVKVVELKNKITRVDGFDPTVVDVTALSANQIRVQAIAQGVTTIVFTDELNATWLLEVFVKGDARHLQAIINAKFPDAAIEAYKIRESVVLRGWVTKPDNITQIVEIAEQFYPRVLNQMKVGGVQQVKLKVKIMEVQRAKIRRMGVNFLYLNQNSFLSSTPGQITQLGSIALPFGNGPSASFNNSTINAASVGFGLIDNSNIFTSFINALKEESLLKILAEPELVTTNGRPATVLSGGEFPILVPQSLGTTTIEWRPFGVSLQAVPIILGGGRLRLELEPEVSERDFTNAVQLNNLTVPGLTTRRVNTQVEMRFGETLMIAGLIATRHTAETDKIPFFGDLPWIGTVFSRKRYDEVETELIVMVTPELVAPLRQEQIPVGGPGRFTTTPTDQELYFHQLLEVPNYGLEPAEYETMAPGTYLPAGVTPQPEVFLPETSGTSARNSPNLDTKAYPVIPPAPLASAQSRKNSQAVTSRNLKSRFPLFGQKKTGRTNWIQRVGFQTPATENGKRPFFLPSRQPSTNPQLPKTTPSKKPTRRRGRPGLIQPKQRSIETLLEK